LIRRSWHAAYRRETAGLRAEASFTDTGKLEPSAGRVLPHDSIEGGANLALHLARPTEDRRGGPDRAAEKASPEGVRGGLGTCE
jgi:hypothetical protein